MHLAYLPTYVNKYLLELNFPNFNQCAMWQLLLVPHVTFKYIEIENHNGWLKSILQYKKIIHPKFL